MKLIGNQISYDIVDPNFEKWDYWQTSDPLITTNPSHLFMTWMNLSTGEKFTCVDNTTDANVWQGNLGTLIAYEVLDILSDGSCTALYSLGANAKDKSGSFDGTDYGVVGYDGIGAYYSSNSYMLFPLATRLASAGFAISFWSRDNGRLQYRSDGNGNNLEMLPSSMTAYSNSTNYTMYSLTDLTRYRHIIFNIVSDTSIQIFVDGVLVHTETVSSMNDLFDNEGRLGVRELDTGALAGYQSGYVSNLRIFSKDLTSDECLYLNTAEKAKYEQT